LRQLPDYIHRSANSHRNLGYGNPSLIDSLGSIQSVNRRAHTNSWDNSNFFDASFRFFPSHEGVPVLT
jgi:hypothetical protein